MFGNGKTVIRGGYGIFYFLDRGGVGEQLSNNPDFNGVSSFESCPGANNNCATLSPNGSRITLSGQIPGGPPYTPIDNNWLAATGALPPPVNTVNVSNPQNVSVIYYPRNSKNSHVQQWNVQFQRQLGTSMALDIAYVGTKMSNLATAFNANNTPLCLGGPAPTVPDSTGLAWVAVLTSTLTSEAAPITACKPACSGDYPTGLTFRSAYTWSHTIDNSNGAFSGSTTDGGGRIFVDANWQPIAESQ